MKYKVGDKVVLRDDLEVYKPYKGAVYTEAINNIADEPLRINWVNEKNKTYYATGGNVISSDMIDHEKTAKLNKPKIYHSVYEIENANEGDLLYLNTKDGTVVRQFKSGEWGEYIVKFEDDAVNHPSHYKQGEYETIDVIKDITRDYSGYEGYLVGNIIKYLYRANYKDNKLEDLKKGQFYYNKLVAVVADGD